MTIQQEHIFLGKLELKRHVLKEFLNGNSFAELTPTLIAENQARGAPRNQIE